MMEYQRKRDTTAVYEPVAYDKSIHVVDGSYMAVVRMDGDVMEFGPHERMEKAQAILELFRPDVFEGDMGGWSVFCHPDQRQMPDVQLV